MPVLGRYWMTLPVMTAFEERVYDSACRTKIIEFLFRGILRNECLGMKIEPSVSIMLRALALFVLDKWCPHCLCGLCVVLRRCVAQRSSALCC